MEVITGEDFELTPSIKASVHEKVEQILAHTDKESLVKVFLSMDAKNSFHVRIQLLSNGDIIFAENVDADFFTALTNAKNKAVRQLDDQKSKKIAKRKQGVKYA